MTAADHDPGGKVRMKLMPGVFGAALFSPCGRYRHILIRTWGTQPDFALWIGMNPSTAEAEVDDPTVRREQIFTRRLGPNGMAKCNVMDYRATDPKALVHPGVEPCSPANLNHIADLAPRAEIVVAAWGKLPKRLRPHADAVMAKLRELNVRPYCLGTTKDGSPRHPLYVRGDTELVPYTQR